MRLLKLTAFVHTVVCPGYRGHFIARFLRSRVGASEGATMIGNVTVGIDPHRKVFTATVLDERGRNLGHEHFPKHWARRGTGLGAGCGYVDRVGIEGASGLGRPLAEYLVSHGVDVRDVPPHKTSLRQRGRHEGKSDRLDAHRIAVETQTRDPDQRVAGARLQALQVRASGPGPDQIALWHNARTSLRKIRVQLIGELDALIHELPEELHDQLPPRATVRARINAVAALDTGAVTDPVHRLRINLVEHRIAMLRDVLAQDKRAESELAKLVTQSVSHLPNVPGIAARAAAEILLETGDVRRFSEASLARFNGTAPIPASSGESGGPPIRHRLNRGGNRRLNAAIHRAAMIQTPLRPARRQIYDHACANGHTRREAMRVLKRHLSNVIYRTMRCDAVSQPLLT